MAEASYSREENPPFLIRTFVKIGSFHRLDLFEDGHLPTTDEHQLFTWKDATLREIVTTLRIIAPHIAEYKHHLARFSFRTVYADPHNHGHFTSKDLGIVHSRELLGDPGAVGTTASRLLEEATPLGKSPESMDVVATEGAGKGKDDNRTLDDMRFVAGDYLLVAVLLPKNVSAPAEIPIKGAAQSWKTGPKGDNGWSGALGSASSSAPAGRGGGHWRGGGPDTAPPVARGRGAGRGVERERDRVDRERDYRRPLLPTRDTGRGGRTRRDRSRSNSRSMSVSRSRSRSRSPRRRRYRD